MEVLDGLLAGPAEGVDAGVDDEACGAPDFGDEAAEVGAGVFVAAHDFAEVLSVEAPALGVAEAEALGLLADAGEAGEFLGHGDLEMVTWNALVQSHRLESVQRPLLRITRVGVKHCGSGVVVRSRVVMRRRCRFFPELLDLAHLEPRGRHRREQGRQLRGDFIDELLVARHDVVAVLGKELRVVLHLIDKADDSLGTVAQIVAHGVDEPLNAVDFLEPELVHVPRVHPQRGEVLHRALIHLLPAHERANPGHDPRARDVLVLHELP
mmetsp:Transcript_1817/g.4902  ORF Transcript_1817/g.4902 Transcript_1817/m.4902 type:complete len:267 (-) Transcript_1817:735-1535(-)